MQAVIKKTLVTLAIFLITPIVIIAINWQWQPQSLNSMSKYLFWLTQTAGIPWAILTCAFFPVLFAICLKIKSKVQFIKLVLILAMAILLGQLFKTVIKSYTADSRPFVIWIEKNHHIDDKYFYSLPRSEREAVIEQYVYQSPEIPNWLFQHWKNETGYTFPSGHTLFAATWAFLALLFLNFKRGQNVIGFIIAWAVFIEISRLALGMHHPIDLICGSILAWAIALFTYYVALKWRVIKR